MRAGDVILHPIEAFRTAPLGSFLLAANSIKPIIEATDFIAHPELNDILASGTSVPAIAASGLLIARQFRLRNRIEGNIQEYGYDERALSTTTSEWCGRQTVRTLLRKTPYIDSYKDLCNKNKSTAKFKWLPHL